MLILKWHHYVTTNIFSLFNSSFFRFCYIPFWQRSETLELVLEWRTNTVLCYPVVQFNMFLFLDCWEIFDSKLGVSVILRTSGKSGPSIQTLISKGNEFSGRSNSWSPVRMRGSIQLFSLELIFCEVFPSVRLLVSHFEGNKISEVNFLKIIKNSQHLNSYV